MCDICGYTTCPPGCPNSAEPEPVGFCAICGEVILPGEEHYRLDGDLWHDWCLKDNAIDVLEERFNAEYVIS